MNANGISRVLVTGGAGYVGNILVPQLLTAGYEVIVYDVMFFGCATLPSPSANWVAVCSIAT